MAADSRKRLRWVPERLRQPPWRTLVPAAALLLVLGLGYLAWSPGQRVRDGRHDQGTNGFWLQHGWLGDDGWFQRTGRDPTRFRDSAKVEALAARLRRHGVAYVFPHLCPCDPDGTVAPVDPVQTERFLGGFEGIAVVPWIGGVLGEHCFPESPAWRATFTASAATPLRAHPRLAGVQVNIEPLPSGNPHFLTLLDELRRALPPGKLLSVAAYPPQTRWHPFPDVHWDEPYFRAVARRCDLLAPMMYDTALRLPKLYEALMADWTGQVLAWAGDTGVLLGVPAYDDAGVGYHHPAVENLPTALAGLHAGLSRLRPVPPNYRGIAVYSEWEMDEREWAWLAREFGRAGQRTRNTSPRGSNGSLAPSGST